MKKFEYPKSSLISYMSNKVKSQGGINLAQGIPSYEPPIELKQILSNLAKESCHQYPPGVGDFDLLEQILNNYNAELDCGLSLENLLITQGATEGISLTYQYVKSICGGNISVLAFNPLYESYKYLPEIFKDQLFVESLNLLAEDNLQELRKTLKDNEIKLVFIASPGNPYGKAIDKKSITNLINLAEELDFYILYDAVYKDLYFNAKSADPLDPLSEKVFYLNSFSKMLSVTGWRIGYMICHETHKTKLRYIHDYTGLCAPSILQKAIAEYLKTSNYARAYLSNLREKLKKSFYILASDLEDVGFEIPDIDGGYFIWGKLPNSNYDSFQWAMNLYDKYAVASIPGMHFSSTDIYFVRFNIAREMDEVKLAGARIKQFCKELANN